MHSEKTLNENFGRSHVNGTPSSKGPTRVTSLLADVTELVELQCKLFAFDAKVGGKRVGVGIIVLVLGLCCVIGAVPILLLALGQLAERYFEFSELTALGASAGCGLAVALAAVGIGWWQVKSGCRRLGHSRVELSHNLALLRQLLTQRK